MNVHIEFTILCAIIKEIVLWALCGMERAAEQQQMQTVVDDVVVICYFCDQILWDNQCKQFKEIFLKKRCTVSARRAYS